MGTREKYISYKPAKLYDKGKKWFVYFSFRNPETGRFVRFKYYDILNSIKDLQEKRAFANKMLGAVDHSLNGGFNPFRQKLQLESIRTWTFAEGLNFFKTKIPDMGLRDKSVGNYESMLRMITDASKNIHHIKLEEITKANCLSILSSLKQERNWSNTTYNNVLTFGRVFFSYLINYNLCKENPFKGVKPLKETNTQHQPFTDLDFKKIKDNADPDLLKFILFLYNTGTRPNEARQLKYEHILRDRKMVLIPGDISKGKKDGYVPVSDAFLKMFPEGKGVIFGTSRNVYTAKFTALKRKLKLSDNYTLYSTKHTRAVHLATDGASPYSIMQLFRHSSLEITMKYLRDLGLNVNREAADKVR